MCSISVIDLAFVLAFAFLMNAMFVANLPGLFVRRPGQVQQGFLQMIWAILYGYAIFGHLPDGVSALGMAVVVASGLALFAHERLAAKAS